MIAEKGESLFLGTMAEIGCSCSSEQPQTHVYKGSTDWTQGFVSNNNNNQKERQEVRKVVGVEVWYLRGVGGMYQNVLMNV